MSKINLAKNLKTRMVRTQTRAHYCNSSNIKKKENCEDFGRKARDKFVKASDNSVWSRMCNLHLEI